MTFKVWLLGLGLLTGNGQVITFDSAAVGKVPPGWTVAMTHPGPAPRWQIVEDRSARTLPYVLAQLSTGVEADRFPLAVFDGLTARDCDVSVRLKPVSGHNDRAGGLVWRYRDENNYYVVRANALEGNVVAYKVVNGQRIALTPRGLGAHAYGVHHLVPSNMWSILKVAVRGTEFSVYVNHRRIMQVDDATFGGAGKVGLWTKADSVIYFDDFRVFPK